MFKALGGLVSGITGPIMGGLTDGIMGDAGKINYDPNKIQGVRDVGGGGQRAQQAFDHALTNGQPAPQIGSAQIDQGLMLRGLDNERRTAGQQLQATDMLQQAAQGQAPSAAQLQMQQGLQQGLRQQLALANSARGGTGASLSAARNAQTTGAQMVADTNQQSAMLRAQEMAEARGALSGHLSGMRGQDLQAAGLGLDFGAQQAGLNQQASLANQDAILGARGLDNQYTLGLGGLAQGYEQMGIDRDLRLQGLNVDLATGQAQNDLTRRGAILGAISGGAQAAFGGGK